MAESQKFLVRCSDLSQPRDTIVTRAESYEEANNIARNLNREIMSRMGRPTADNPVPLYYAIICIGKNNDSYPFHVEDPYAPCEMDLINAGDQRMSNKGRPKKQKPVRPERLSWCVVRVSDGFVCSYHHTETSAKFKAAQKTSASGQEYVATKVTLTTTFVCKGVMANASQV